MPALPPFCDATLEQQQKKVFFTGIHLDSVVSSINNG